MGRSSLDTTGIDDIKKRLEKAAEIISRKQGARIDLKKEKIFTKGGSFLHQSTASMSEEESAQFERDNPELFAYLLALNEQMKDLF